MSTITIGNTAVGANHPIFIIAEIGINYDGNFEQACKLIDAAAQSGCNAVKFQLFRAKKMYTSGAGQFETASGEKKDIQEIIKQSELPHEWIPKLQDYAHGKKLEFFVTVCDEESADVLEQCNVDAYKFASYAITHIPLLCHVAKKQKPMLLSTACATLGEVDEAIQTLNNNNSHIVLNHCMGKYPTPLDQVNLNILKTFQLAYPELIIGYSDHTSEPSTAPCAAVALGAKVIEKHITLDRNLPGPDHSFAVDPLELTQMVKDIRKTEAQLSNKQHIKIEESLLGSSKRQTFAIEETIRNFAYRSIFATAPIKKGESFSENNIAVLRPGEKQGGIHPRYYPTILSRAAARDIASGSAIIWDDLLA